MQSPAHIAKNAVRIVWKRSKSALTDRYCPLSVSTTRFGFSKQEHFTFVSFYGQSLRPWRQAHDSIRKNIFTLSCSLLRIREKSRTLSAILLMRWCRYRQTYYYGLSILGRREGLNNGGQGCKDKEFLHPCTVGWKATTKGKDLFHVYVVFYSTLLFRENGVYW